MIAARAGQAQHVQEEAGLLLHARRLTFAHPKTEKPLTFEASLPRDFQDYLKTLRGK